LNVHSKSDKIHGERGYI